MNLELALRCPNPTESVKRRQVGFGEDGIYTLSTGIASICLVRWDKGGGVNWRFSLDLPNSEFNATGCVGKSEDGNPPSVEREYVCPAGRYLLQLWYFEHDIKRIYEIPT